MKTYEEALAVQDRYQNTFMSLPGVTAVGVKSANDQFVLEVTVDPDAQLPQELNVNDVDGLPLRIVRGRYELH